MRVSRQELLDALVRVGPGLAPVPRITQSECYAFKRGWVVCFNDEVCARTRSPLPADFVGAVPAAQFKAAVESFPDDAIDLEIQAGALKVGARGTSARVRFEPEIILPIDDVKAPAEWFAVPDPDALAAAIRHASAACGTNDEEFLAVCVHVTPTFMEGTNRFQAGKHLAELGLDPDDPDNDFVVRAKSLKPVASYGVTLVGKTPDWLHFRSESVVYSCRRSVEPYLDLGPSWEFAGEKLILPKGAGAAAKLAAVFAGSDKAKARVRVAMRGRRMEIVGAGTQGESRSYLDAGYDGPPLEFDISPTLLEEIVKKHNECEIDQTRLFVRGDCWMYVAALFQTEEQANAARDADVPAPDAQPEEVADDAEYADAE